MRQELRRFYPKDQVEGKGTENMPSTQVTNHLEGKPASKFKGGSSQSHCLTAHNKVIWIFRIVFGVLLLSYENTFSLSIDAKHSMIPTL